MRYVRTGQRVYQNSGAAQQRFARRGSRLVLLPLLLLLVLLAGCGMPAPTTAVPEGETSLLPVLAASELTVGSNRIPIGILRNGTPLNDPNLTLQLRFFYLDGGEKDTVQNEVAAVYRGQGLPLGLYVAYTTFDQPGAWSMEVTIPDPAKEPVVSRVRLNVEAEPRVPSIGSAAIPSQTLTVRDNADLKQLTSDYQPDPDLYQLSIAEALAGKQPFLVTFSTPGYCQTAVCAPNLQVVKQLKDEFKGQVNFIHVEVYPYPFSDSFARGQHVPAMREWRLRTEPWTFLVDAQGTIQARYEGGITFAELEPALKQLAAGEPVTPLQ